MAGKANSNAEVPMHSCLWLLIFLPVFVLTGCVPTIGMNVWPVPTDYRPYLPPDEKEDVLLFCLYDDDKDKGLIADDVQILNYPYNEAHLGMTGHLGLVSVAWGYGMHRTRHSIWLFSHRGQIIYIPLRPYEARDDALSYFYVMDAPPLKTEDFCHYKKGNPAVFFNCVSSPGYFPQEVREPDAQYRWPSFEDAVLARNFWQDCSACQESSSASVWRMHSIFGTTGQVLNSRKCKSSDF